jgi:hypothetical protein
MASTEAQAASMIRKHLKSLGIVARVRSRSASMMNAVDVYLTDADPATVQKVEEYVDQFQYGHFDGMTDCYEYSNKRDDLPQVKYTHVSVTYTDAVQQKAWDHLRGYLGGMESAPANVNDGRNFRNVQAQEYGSQLLWQTLNGSVGKFWEARS